MSQNLLTLAEAAEIVPLSERQLRRVANRGGPFRKVEGRWMVYESELHDWVRSHRPRERDSISREPIRSEPIRPQRRQQGQAKTKGGKQSSREQVKEMLAQREGRAPGCPPA